MVSSFYDALAPYYHLIYPDWEASGARQSQALVRLLDTYGVPPGSRILDAACGIGTQTLGLAAAGYTVAASDVSSGAVARLEHEADTRRLAVTARVADLRALSESWPEQFDALLACDNAIPHLLSDAEISGAFTECRRCLRAGGVFVASVRDYAAIPRVPRDVHPYGSRTEGGRRYSAEQVWEWDGDCYDLTLRLTEEAPGDDARTHLFRTRYYAVTIPRLLELMVAAGFVDVERRDGEFFQPVVIGMAP
jgi:SAM-dependent methyltransferase